MNRRIITQQQVLQGPTIAIPAASADSYLQRLVKYIPADINAAWIVVTGLISSASNVSRTTVLWIAFIVGMIVTAVWTWDRTREGNKPPALTQILISTGAFVVWVIALGGPFTSLDFYRPLYGSLLLILYTVLVALVTPPEG